MVDDDGAHQMVEPDELADAELLDAALVGLVGEFAELVGALGDAQVAVG